MHLFWNSLSRKPYINKAIFIDDSWEGDHFVVMKNSAVGMCCIVMVLISSLRLDLGSFRPGTQTAGSSFKVPLSLLGKVILEGELQ